MPRPHHPADNFHLIDLESQAEAVQSLLAGRSPDEKVAWFAAHGTLTPASRMAPGGPQVYYFESAIGFQCIFFIDGEDLVFIGDNTTWSVPRPSGSSAAGGGNRRGR